MRPWSRRRVCTYQLSISGNGRKTPPLTTSRPWALCSLSLVSHSSSHPTQRHCSCSLGLGRQLCVGYQVLLFRFRDISLPTNLPTYKSTYLSIYLSLFTLFFEALKTWGWIASFYKWILFSNFRSGPSPVYTSFHLAFSPARLISLLLTWLKMNVYLSHWLKCL